MTTPQASRIVTVGLPQMRASTDPGETLERTIVAIREAAARGAQIICTQELFLGPYFCQSEDHQYFRLAESIPGPTTTQPPLSSSPSP